MPSCGLRKKVPGTEVYTYALARAAARPLRRRRVLSCLSATVASHRQSRWWSGEMNRFAAIVGDEEVELKESFVVTVVDE